MQTNSLSVLSGHELNLYAYYPMDEMQGTIATDKASGKNLKMEGCQWTLPEGRSIALDGKSQYVKISTGSTAVIDETMDFTVELWFKGGKGSANSNGNNGNNNSTLISNGRGDGSDFGGSKYLFWLGFKEGLLSLRNNSQLWSVDGDFLDDSWHHVAVTANRISKRLQIVVDGKILTNTYADNLGGISAAYANIGACEYTLLDSENTRENVYTDGFFQGSIDEVRLWSIKKERSQIESSSRTALEGTETGLLAYYPFEDYKDWQGTKELKFTLEDKRVPEDPSYTVPSAIVVVATEGANRDRTDNTLSDISLSDNTLSTFEANEANFSLVESHLNAPVRDKGPISKLLYDYVVRDNSIVINLLEDLDRIEGTTVDVAIEKVRDLNANQMVNPVTWSVFVDMAPLKWVDSSVKPNVVFGQGGSFQVEAYNRSGAAVDYTIDNLPSWLSATPSYGTISPAGKVVVEFEIDKALNIGSYSENIYLTDANGVTSVLALSVSCAGEKPDWNVNPAMYDYSMSLFGQIRIMDSVSDDEEDMLAAFIGDECVGVSNTVYDPAMSLSYVPLSIYCNEAKGSELSFRIYDASTGRIYDAATEDGNVITFSADKMIGTPSKPKVFVAKENFVQVIDLNPGWQWISINVVDQTMDDLNACLGRYEWATADQVKDEANGKSAQYSTASTSPSSNGTWNGTLTALSNPNMYKIKTGFEHTIEFTGPAVDTDKMPITIKGTPEGEEDLVWNYIPYLPMVNLPINEPHPKKCVMPI